MSGTASSKNTAQEGNENLMKLNIFDEIKLNTFEPASSRGAFRTLPNM